MFRPSVASLLVPAIGSMVAVSAVAAEPVSTRISGIEVTGSVDPEGRVESFIDALVPAGSPLVETSDPDDENAPPPTLPRLSAALDRIGYHADVEIARTGASARLRVKLRAYDRLRRIFVSGNGRIRLRQDEVIRRLTVRPGTPLALPGPERDETFERDRQSVLTFLHNEGYFDAKVVFRLESDGNTPAAVDLHIGIEAGVAYPIGPIEVRGNKELSTEEIEEQFRHTDWAYLWTRPLPFRLSLLEQDRRKVVERYHDLGFAAATVRSLSDPATSADTARKEFRLVLDVYENRRIELAFEGNKHFDDNDLSKVVTFFDRGSINNHEREASAEAIAQHYRNRGYMFVKVDWRRDLIAENTDRIVFVIDEGPVVKVRKVAFSGNTTRSSEALADYATVKEFPFLGAIGLGEGGYATLRQLEINEERLEGFYNGDGRHDAKVRSEVSPDDKEYMPLSAVRREDPRWAQTHALYVRFLVDEGPLVTVSEVRFRLPPGETLPLDESLLRKTLQQNEGRPYLTKWVRADAQTLERALGDLGHPNARAEAIPTREGNTVRIEWDIKPGPKRRVGWVFVRGNFITRERTILQWIPLEVGSPLKTTSVERGQRNLGLVQLLNNPNPISFPEAAEAGDQVPMVLNIEERYDYLGRLLFGGGVSTEQATPGARFPLGPYVAAGYEHRNVFGFGWTFQTRGQVGTSMRELRSDFANQRWLGSTIRLELSGTYRREATLRLGDTRTGEGSIAFRRIVYPGVDVAIRYSLRNTTRTELLLRASGADENQETVRPGTTVGALGASVTWDRVDNVLVPTRGIKTYGSVEIANPAFSAGFGEDSFIKAQLRTLTVVPIGSAFSVRHTVRYDQGFVLGDRSVLPKVERFFLGGDSTVRGYQLDMARKQETQAVSAPGIYFSLRRPVGGSLRLIGNLELLYHVGGPLWSGVFLDSGLLADSFDGITARQFRHGAGVTPLSLRLPFGDLSMSWGVPLDPVAGDSRYGRLHVNVGLMF